MSKHLDLGCGERPRNPYGANEVFGVDIAVGADASKNIVGANLALQPIPFKTSEFDSVSAYDFLEHIPRVLMKPDGTGTRLPFVDLMGEVWRVLRPGGVFYASTPVYPAEAAFRDPTHVNIITSQTHTYFCRPARKAQIYGYLGDFEVRRVQLARPNAQMVYLPIKEGPLSSIKQDLNRRLGRYSHVIWELTALK